MVRLIQSIAGVETGWFAVEPTLTLDRDGAVLVPAAASIDAEDDAPYMERLRSAHRRQFHEVKLDGACPAAPASGTVFVLVHGIGGEGTEWVGVIPTLAQLEPAAIYMYRWFAYAERGVIVQGLVDGVQQLASCHPDHPIVVLGHSAGGVVTAFAASRFRLKGRPAPVTLITVASPLAGVGARPEIQDADDHMHFFNDLGTTHRSYPAASAGVAVLHLRTQYPGDVIMKPTRAGYSPNAPSAVVKGSRVLDLPGTLGHDDSLLYVARELRAGHLP
ncbi:MAG: hypothetical protein JNK82_03545 [Myxococcaceae bacterium]|nr:hypothetical protein [Myxococcaceae bacterium]